MLDGQYVDAAEAGLGRVPADGVGPDCGTGTGGVGIEQSNGQAVQDGEAEAEARRPPRISK